MLSQGGGGEDDKKIAPQELQLKPKSAELSIPPSFPVEVLFLICSQPEKSAGCAAVFCFRRGCELILARKLNLSLVG